MHQAHHTSQVGQSFDVRHKSLRKELASNQLFLILLISLLILSCCFVALCRFVLLYADEGAPPRDPFYFMIFQSLLFHISLYHFILLFMLPSFSLLSSLSCSLSSCLLLSLYRFIPLYANLCVALCCLEPAWGAAASPSKSQAAPGVDARACQSKLRKAGA